MTALCLILVALTIACAVYVWIDHAFRLGVRAGRDLAALDQQHAASRERQAAMRAGWDAWLARYPQYRTSFSADDHAAREPWGDN